MKIGIVVSMFYWDEITSKMLSVAEQTAMEEQTSVVIRKVPGCYDMPLAVQQLLEEGVDGVVTLGALITGDTKHDELIAFTIAHAFTGLSLKYNKPVVLGVNGPGMTVRQATQRIPRAAEVTRACLKLLR